MRPRLGQPETPGPPANPFSSTPEGLRSAPRESPNSKLFHLSGRKWAWWPPIGWFLTTIPPFSGVPVSTSEGLDTQVISLQEQRKAPLPWQPQGAAYSPAFSPGHSRRQPPGGWVVLTRTRWGGLQGGVSKSTHTGQDSELKTMRKGAGQVGRQWRPWNPRRAWDGAFGGAGWLTLSYGLMGTPQFP